MTFADSICPATRVASMVLFAAATLLATGCGSDLTVQTHRDPSIRIPAKATYAWDPTPLTPKHPAELDPRANNPTIHGRVKRAIETVLASKGFRQVDPATADFLVQYRVGVRDRREWQQTATGGPGARHMTVRPLEYTEGGLMINLVERSTGKVAFQSLGLEDVTKEDASEKAILDDVTRLLKELP